MMTWYDIASMMYMVDTFENVLQLWELVTISVSCLSLIPSHPLYTDNTMAVIGQVMSVIYDLN